MGALARARVDEFLALLRHEPDGDRLVGQTPDWEGQPVFGGIGLAMTTSAACTAAPPGSRLHSLHAHFLRPVWSSRDVFFETEDVKVGRAFHVLRVTASQDDKPGIVMTCSFTADAEGPEYDVSGIPEGVPLPDDVRAPPEDPDDLHPWDERWLGPTPVRSDGTYEATHRHWFRLPVRLADDPHLHASLFAYATDWTGTGGRPLSLDGDITGMISLDHAAWFHRPSRADEWHLQDVHSVVNAGGRGTLRGVIRNQQGQVVASMAQEMLFR